MRAGESTFMGCPLSYLHPQAIPLAPRSLENYIAEGLAFEAEEKKQTHGWRSAAALARSTPVFLNDTACESECKAMGLELPTSCVTAMRISSSVTKHSQGKVRCCNQLEFPARSLAGKTTPGFQK